MIPSKYNSKKQDKIIDKINVKLDMRNTQVLNY